MIENKQNFLKVSHLHGEHLHGEKLIIRLLSLNLSSTAWQQMFLTAFRPPHLRKWLRFTVFDFKRESTHDRGLGFMEGRTRSRGLQHCLCGPIQNWPQAHSHPAIFCNRGKILTKAQIILGLCVQWGRQCTRNTPASSVLQNWGKGKIAG